MKKALLITLLGINLFLFPAINSAAQVTSANFYKAKNQITGIPGYGRNQRTTTSCTPDTIAYTYEKATGLRGLNMNSATSASKVGQWFPAPQNITISGFIFYAWQNNHTADTVNLICRVYLANTDSLPTGAPLASATIKVDSTFRNGTLAALEKVALFSSPITIFFPYVVTVETSSAITVAVVSSDWDSTDGGKEWLGMASIAGSWLHGYDISVGGPAFDADFMFFPFVGYNIDASFTSSVTCIPSGGTVSFINTSSSPIVSSKFYNQLAYSGQDSLIYTWNYDDNTPLGFVFDGPHVFPAGLNYQVVLTSNLLGWSTTCTATSVQTINENVVSNFSYTFSDTTATFNDLSTGATQWLWDFGDGDTSHAQNPVHTFPSMGNYNVCLTANNSCITNTACKNISSSIPTDISAEGLSGLIRFYADPFSGSLLVKSDPAVFAEQEEITFFIFNVQGKKEMQFSLNEQEGAGKALNFAGHPPGIYVVWAHLHQGFFKMKLIFL